MSLLQLPHAAPKLILFDWHATLADTMDAMYHAVDDVLPKLEELHLIDRLVKTEDSKSLEDAKLVKYVREYARLHPKVKEARKISRTDIFEVLFGDDHEAKHIVHSEFDECYRNHYGEVYPMEDGIREMLTGLHRMGLKSGVLSNRNREFMEHELAVVDGTGWLELFDTITCGDDVAHRKPAPDLILHAVASLDLKPNTDTWYVGDSTTDVVAAKEARVTSVFYNGARWEQAWLDKIFPGTTRHPHKPDAVINNFQGLSGLARMFLHEEHEHEAHINAD